MNKLSPKPRGAHKPETVLRELRVISKFLDIAADEGTLRGCRKYLNYARRQVLDTILLARSLPSKRAGRR